VRVNNDQAACGILFRGEDNKNNQDNNNYDDDDDDKNSTVVDWFTAHKE